MRSNPRVVVTTRLTRAGLTQCRGVVAQVVFDEAADEVIAVVVARMAAQCQRLANLCTGLLKKMRLQLRVQKLVTQALVNQDTVRKQGTAARAHECGCVVLLPSLGRIA